MKLLPSGFSWVRRCARAATVVQTGNWRWNALRFGLPTVGTAGIGVYSYIQHGLTWRMLLPLTVFWVVYLYHRFGLMVLGKINYRLLFPAGFSLYLSFLLWDPSQYSPFGSDPEYPHLAGLAFGLVMGMSIVIDKSIEDGDGTLVETVRAMGHYGVLLSGVAVAGYAMFLPYSYAMHQVFAEGNHIFAILALASITTFLAFAHNKAKFPAVPHDRAQ